MLNKKRTKYGKVDEMLILAYLHEGISPELIAEQTKMSVSMINDIKERNNVEQLPAIIKNQIEPKATVDNPPVVKSANEEIVLINNIYEELAIIGNSKKNRIHTAEKYNTSLEFIDIISNGNNELLYSKNKAPIPSIDKIINKNTNRVRKRKSRLPRITTDLADEIYTELRDSNHSIPYMATKYDLSPDTIKKIGRGLHKSLSPEYRFKSVIATSANRQNKILNYNKFKEILISIKDNLSITDIMNKFHVSYSSILLIKNREHTYFSIEEYKDDINEILNGAIEVEATVIEEPKEVETKTEDKPVVITNKNTEKEINKEVSVIDEFNNKYNKLIKYLRYGMINDRHPMPVSKYIFDQEIKESKTNDYDWMYRKSEEFITKRCIIDDKPVYGLLVYLTGMNPIIMSIVKVCYNYKINLTCMHYHPSTGKYYPDVIYNFSDEQMLPTTMYNIQSDNIYCDGNIDDFVNNKGGYELRVSIQNKSKTSEPEITSVLFTNKDHVWEQYLSMIMDKYDDESGNQIQINRVEIENGKFVVKKVISKSII